MHRLRLHLLPILIILITFVSPICFVLSMSMWLEWFDPWIVFVWGQWSQVSRVVEISLLNTEVPFMSLMNRTILSMAWIVLGVVLVISYYFDVRNSRKLVRGLITALIVLIIQTILPILLIRNGLSELRYGHLVPLPIPSLISIFIIVVTFYINQKSSFGASLFGRLLLGFVSLFAYLPVVAGIISIMLWLFPAWYSAWYVIGFIFPFSSIWGGLWLPFPSPLVALLIYIIQGIVFFAGLALFFLALFKMMRKNSDGVSLDTTGPYSWVRHPQHLGIILFLLPLALFNLSTTPSWTGIRPGDILSWSLVSFMLLVAADLEEYALVKRFGSEYIDYARQTQFILPRVSLFGFMDKYVSLSKGKPLRYVIWFVLYWCIASLILYGFTFLELSWTL